MRKPAMPNIADRLQSVTRGRTTTRSGSAPDNGWARTRGEDRVRGTFDALGNFPGYASSAALIVGGSLVITGQYLILDEWAPHGFALPLDEIVDVSIDSDPDTFEDLIVRHGSIDGNMIFRLRSGKSRLPGRSRIRTPDVLQALSEIGVPEADMTRTLFDAYSVTWDALNANEPDVVVWKGRVTAPLRPGRECAPTDVWVTPSAIIWGNARGRGVSRVPLSAVERLGAVNLGNASQTPAVYIRVGPVGDTWLDLPFIFNQAGHSNAADQRDSFLAIFRGDALREVNSGANAQPWLASSDESDPLIPETPEHQATVETSSVEAPELAPETVADPDINADDLDTADEQPDPAFETWAELRRPVTFTYGSGEDTLAARRLDVDQESVPYSFDSSGTRLADAITSWPGLTTPEESHEPEPAHITEPRALLTYLARARRSIDEVNDAVDRRIAGQAAPVLRALPPSSEEQSEALAELIELAGTDYYSVEQARTVKAQITRLGEAAVRLRSLLELCNAGHLTIAEVGLKRDVIMSGLPTEDGIE